VGPQSKGGKIDEMENIKTHETNHPSTNGWTPLTPLNR